VSYTVVLVPIVSYRPFLYLTASHSFAAGRSSPSVAGCRYYVAPPNLSRRGSLKCAGPRSQHSGDQSKQMRKLFLRCTALALQWMKCNVCVITDKLRSYTSTSNAISRIALHSRRSTPKAAFEHVKSYRTRIDRKHFIVILNVGGDDDRGAGIAGRNPGISSNKITAFLNGVLDGDTSHAYALVLRSK
jgi:hypothetical protein